MKHPVTCPPPMSRIAARSHASTIACVLLVALAAMGPACARPLAAPKAEPERTQAETISDLKARGEKAQRLAETRQRLWDRKMKAVSGSVCIGC